MKNPIRNAAILNIEKDAKNCFTWSILTHLHPFENSHSVRVSKYTQYFNYLKIEGLHFSNGFKCSYVHRFETLFSLSVNFFKLEFYKEGLNRKHNLVPSQISENITYRVVDIMLYRNHYVLTEKYLYF